MGLSFFLAELLGWYLLILSLVMLIRKDVIKGVLKGVLAQEPLIFILGILTTLLGLMIVITHNLWIMNWPVAITIFGWMTLLGGIMRMSNPAKVARLGTHFIESPSYMIFSFINLAFSLFLLYEAYLS